MKLYAITTSERASKGQGGKYIAITILNENKNQIGIVRVMDGMVGYWFSDSLTRVAPEKLPSSQTEKGNKQEGEVCGFKNAVTGEPYKH